MFLTLLAAPTARATALMGPEASQVVDQAESYLQSLRTAQAKFTQTGNDGRQATGTFYLSRPGRLRFEYDPPVKDLVVADGLFVYFFDGETGQQSNAPTDQTLANFLLRRNIKLRDDVTVTNVGKSTRGLLLITLVQTDRPSDGSLTLAFEENPLRLKKWRVVDATRAITEVELTDLQTNIKLPASLFVYKEPGRSHYNN
jgi:outer membrane lipoprotein-sorting protein